jgi:hypothetical protein
MPPLRERGRDILLLAEHFLKRACADYNLPQRTLAADARAALQAYRWPGNIRELSNVIERVALLSEAPVVTAKMLGLPDVPLSQPQEAARPDEAISLATAVGAVERDHLLDALTQTNWNITRAAAGLGISRDTLRYRIQKHNLHPPAPLQRRRRGASGPKTLAPSVAAHEPQALAVAPGAPAAVPCPRAFGGSGVGSLLRAAWLRRWIGLPLVRQPGA